MAAAAGTAPRAAKWARRDRLLSLSTSRYAATSTSTQIGGLTKNTQRHPGPPDSRPPARTPTTGAAPTIAPHAPRALSRSVPWLKLVVRIDSPAGLLIGAPRP